ncbi:MAG: DUF2147 domain-containing protein [Devosia sp.]|nr:DUF2147 domain-containing protein [Devosia sp.]
MRQIVGLGMALALGLAMTAPTLAEPGSVVGNWVVGKDSAYAGSFCGADGKAFCLTVTRLSGGMDTPKNRLYLGANIIDKAKPSGNQRWKGKLNLFGQTADTTISLKNENTLLLHGCVYVVICKDMELARAD